MDEASLTMLLGACVDIARMQVAVRHEELETLAAARLGIDRDDPAGRELLDAAEVELLEGPDAPLTILAPDLVIHVPALTEGAVLTHRLSDVERAESFLALDGDLAVFRRTPTPTVAQGPLELDDEGTAWWGPDGWLVELPVGALLTVQATVDGAVRVEVVEREPTATPELVAAVRDAYDREVAQAWLPVPADLLVVAVLHADRAAFAEPRPPLTDLAAAAGLERREDEFAHEGSVWQAGQEADRQYRLIDRFPDGGAAEASEALDLLVRSAEDPSALRRVLDLIAEPDVVEAVVDELLWPDESPDSVAALVTLGDRLLAAAGTSPRAATAGWVAAVAAERDGRVLDAESHLRAAAAAADGWPFVEDRLAWYESDRGDAAAARGRWLAIGTPADEPDVAVLPPAATGPEPGRNDPCWCGSGRKYKQCHLGRPALPPLPERVGWLWRKSVAYLDRRGGAAQDAILDAAEARAGDDGELDAALADRLVTDVVLHEDGWFGRFLHDRGPLLPEDEALLAASWLMVDRSVYEVLETRPGEGMTVRDLRTGDRLVVRERLARPAVGDRLCGRAVPDGSGPDGSGPEDSGPGGSGPEGSGRRFVGSVFGVPVGRQRALLKVLDEGDGLELLEWVADHSRPAVTVEPPTASPAVEQLRALRERRWCDEPVPALDGRTPRAAADDPTRRDELLRLIASFPDIDPATGAFGLRPARLRELLGLS